MAIKVEDIKLTKEQITKGGTMILVDVAPYFKYKDNEKTDIVEGYRYTVALPNQKFEKIGVKVAGNQQLEISDDDSMMQVDFTGFEAKFFRNFKTKEYILTANADSIEVI